MAKYANQKTIIREEETEFRPYAKISIESMQKAMKELSNYEFKLYCLLYMNQEGYEYDLSPAYLEKTFAGTRKTWSAARKALEEKGYLRVEEGNRMVFVELPEEEETVPEIEVEKVETSKGWDF